MPFAGARRCRGMERWGFDAWCSGAPAAARVSRGRGANLGMARRRPGAELGWLGSAGVEGGGWGAGPRRTDGRWRTRFPRRRFPARVRRPQRRRFLQGRPPAVEPRNIIFTPFCAVSREHAGCSRQFEHNFYHTYMYNTNFAGLICLVGFFSSSVPAELLYLFYVLYRL